MDNRHPYRGLSGIYESSKLECSSWGDLGFRFFCLVVPQPKPSSLFLIVDTCNPWPSVSYWCLKGVRKFT